MRSLVVYESMFGNTEKVAHEVGEVLGRHGPCTVCEVADAPHDLAGLDLLVVGGPTHAFSMTRPSTRADAVRQGATARHTDTGIREWLDSLPEHVDGHAPLLATFDTRVGKARHLPGSASKSAARHARHHGLRAICPGQSFYVDDVAGPLVDGEIERVDAWAEALAEC